MADSTLSTEQAAERLGVTVAALYESRRRNQKPGMLGLRRGRQLRWRPSDLDRYLSAEPDEVEHLTAADAMVLELQAVNKLLRKMNAQLGTIALYLERAEARLEEPIE